MNRQPEDDSERVASLVEDNRRLRELLAAAGRLAEFGRFAAKQTHELRQPLFAIKGLAQLLLDRHAVDPQEVHDFAKHIVEQSERLTGLVTDLRHLSMPAPRAGRAFSDVSPELLRVASLLDWRFRKGVTLRTEITGEVPPVALGTHQLEQILINLISNALDAVGGQPHPTLQIRVGLHVGVEPNAPAMVEILVADNGSGVPLGARARLFENFFTTKGEESGTGLGLAVSREIARGVGGDLILLESPGLWNEPASTCFRLTLPAAGQEPSAGAA